MSVRISTWVWQHSGAAGNDLLILLALADQANDGGLCWPSASYIADKTRLSRRTVQRRLAELAGEGKVIAFTSGKTRGASNVYQFLVEDAVPVQPEVRQGDASGVRQIGVRHGDGTTPSGVGGVTPTVAPGTTPSDARNVSEPSGNRQSAGKPAATTARGTRIPDDFTVSEAMSAWARENAPGTGLRDHEAFCDYWRSVAGARGRKTDWVATWRNWMRRASDDRGGSAGRQGSAQGESPEERRFREERERRNAS